MSRARAENGKKINHYVVMEIDGDQLTMRAIDIDGKEFDRHTIVKNPDGSVTDAYRAKARPEEALIASTRDMLPRILPGVALDGVEWATYRVDRAEGATRGGLRPTDTGLRSACGLSGNSRTSNTSWQTRTQRLGRWALTR